MLRTVRLYGELGAKYGRVHKLAVGSASAAVRALCILIPGFEKEFKTAYERGIGYAVFLGQKNIGRAELQQQINEDIRIAPMIQGSKRGGLFHCCFFRNICRGSGMSEVIEILDKAKIQGAKKGGGGGGSSPIEFPDNLKSTSYARALDIISEGKISGLVDGAKSVYLDETPLQNADGSYNISEC